MLSTTIFPTALTFALSRSEAVNTSPLDHHLEHNHQATGPDSTFSCPKTSTDHQQEDDGQSIQTIITASSTAPLSINTASAANIIPAGPPTSTDLIRIQPVYLPAISVSLGQAVDDYKRDQHSEFPTAQPPIAPPTTPNRQRTQPALRTPRNGSHRRREPSGILLGTIHMTCQAVYGSRDSQNRIHHRISKKTPTGEVVLGTPNLHVTTVRHENVKYLLQF